jgi:ATP-dependent Lon protease
VKEKVLAAHRAGIKMVLLPERNRADLEEIPRSILEENQIEFRFVKEMGQVLETALLSKEESKRETFPLPLEEVPVN